MSETAPSPSYSHAGPDGRPRVNMLRLYLTEALTELVKVWRLPVYSLSTLAFPTFFYLIFGVAMGGQRAAGSVTVATYLLATYGAFGVMGSALFGFGVGVAIERGQGWLLAKRATPMPPLAYFVAKLFTSMVFGALVVGLLFTLGAVLGGVRLAATQWLLMAAIQVAGAVPFCAAGLALGYAAGPNSAPAVVNLVYLPVSFASGLWIPIEMLPALFKKVAVALPPYHYAQLALKVLGAGQGQPVLLHVAFLVAFTVVCLALAVLGYRRDQGRTFG